ncbi:AEC family transporter [Acinetobacter sp. ASP199]|uniref:AEC family transporter n=1 Tax=unclassified Acinetobacter TaxID=196816 RepID=UPI001F61DB82|nr:AEC family transporter [Acinetobacter sp. ASP199]UNT58705.1 AEC family transporter [Acinetobacter sp. ASP199]
MLFSILFPICAVVFLGYIAARTQFITPSLITAMSQFVMKISLPAFLLQALASKNLSDIWSPQYFIAYAGGSLLLYALVFFCCRYFFKAPLTESSVLAMGGSMSNTGFIGTAILTLLIGSHSAIYLSLTLIVENLLIVTLMLVLAERGLQAPGTAGKSILAGTLLRIFKNPVIVSIMLGILCILLDIQLPELLASTLKMLGQTASPLALFVIGGSLIGMNLRSLTAFSWFLTAMKVIVMPLLIFSLLWAFDVSREMLFIGTLLAALPMPIALGIFAQHYGVQEKALPPLVLSTLMGFIVVAVILTQSGYYLS